MSDLNSNTMRRAAAPASFFARSRRAITHRAIVAMSLVMAASSHAQAPAKPALADANIATATVKATAKATFAGGCFWCVESDFDKVPGVISTTSGYIGGKTAKPTYEQVSGHGTGHAEAVEIVFDPAKVSYAQLVEHFWRTIDPTTKDQQFCDRGSPQPHGDFCAGRTAVEDCARLPKRVGEVKTVQGAHRHRSGAGQRVLPGRGLSPRLLFEKSSALQILPQQLWPRCAVEAVVGRQGCTVKHYSASEIAINYISNYLIYPRARSVFC